jgi:YVTN family beta-propeller protein
MIAAVMPPGNLPAQSLTNQVVTTVTVGEDPSALAVTPDSKEVYVANFLSNTVTVIDASLNTVVATIPVGTEPAAIAITPDGGTAFVSNFFDNTVSVISTSTHTVTNRLSVGVGPLGLAVSPDGTQLCVANYGSPVGPHPAKNGSVWIVNTGTFATLKVINTQSRPDKVSLTTDGKWLYVVDGNSFVLKIDTTLQKIVKRNIGKGTLFRPAALTISQDQKTLYIANGTFDVFAFNAIDYSLIKAIPILPTSGGKVQWDVG